MNANIIKRAPKWAWLTAAGVGAGVVGIRLWRDRAAPADTSQTATTVGDGTTPGSTSGGQTPVIIPPVINQDSSGGTDSGSADAASVLTAISGIFTPIIDDFTTVIGAQQGTIGTVVAQEGSDLGTALSAVSANNDSWLAALASGGLAPQPAAQAPTVIVTSPAPPTPAQGPAGSQCPATYPHHSARGCYKCRTEKNKTITHIYRDGSEVGGNKTCA